MTITQKERKKNYCRFPNYLFISGLLKMFLPNKQITKLINSVCSGGNYQIVKGFRQTERREHAEFEWKAPLMPRKHKI